ncbi:hypothetical protein AcV7_005102 [Taiwanofungus camphoratus]|nr:hypothetical protein AcV7_005102 [Antrodia cinnamomea]
MDMCDEESQQRADTTLGPADGQRTASVLVDHKPLAVQRLSRLSRCEAMTQTDDVDEPSPTLPLSHNSVAYKQVHSGEPILTAELHPTLGLLLPICLYSRCGSYCRGIDTMQVRQAGSPAIGIPVLFTAGIFAGRTIRAEILQLQKADLGRKYARKDRRPLDPPPIVQLKLFQVHHSGTSAQTETEIDYDELQSYGILCHADLFPVPLPDTDVDVDGDDARDCRSSMLPETDAQGTQAGSNIMVASAHSPASSAPSSSGSSSGSDLRPRGIPHQHHRQTPWAEMVAHLSSPPGALLPPLQPPFDVQRVGPVVAPDASHAGSAAVPYLHTGSGPPRHWPSAHAPQPGGSEPHYRLERHGQGAHAEGAVAFLDGHAVREDAKCTEQLAGTTVVEAMCAEYAGRGALLFIFPDLSVRAEGAFVLRYRAFSITSQAGPGAAAAPVLAECVGGPFRVFGTKAFPGLRASTDLTKHISRFGARLNIREHQRTRRGRAPMRTEPHPHPHPHPQPLALKPRLRPKPLALAPAGRRRSAGPASDRGGGGDGDGDRYGGESSVEDGWVFGA